MIPDDLKLAIELYGDTWRAYHCVAECRFIEKYHKMPNWAHFIESFTYIEETDSFVFVHRDTKAVQ